MIPMTRAWNSAWTASWTVWSCTWTGNDGSGVHCGRPNRPVSAHLQVDAGVEGVGRVGDVPDGQHRDPAGVAAQVDRVRDRRRGHLVVAAEVADLGAADVVLVVRCLVARRERPVERHGLADTGRLP